MINALAVFDALSNPALLAGMDMRTRLKYWRELRGLTEAQIAREIGTSQPNYHRIETGQQKLTVELMRKLAAALGVSPLDLLPVAVTAALENDVEPASISGDATTNKALELQGVSAYKVLLPTLDKIGIAVGSQLVASSTAAAISNVSTGAAVIASALDKTLATNDPKLLLRMFVAPTLLITNSTSRNVVIDMNSDEIDVRIVAVAQLV